MEQLITLFLIIAGVIITTTLLVIKYQSSKVDGDIETFYKAIEYVRNSIHTCTSKAESLELIDDIAHIRESFENIVPQSVIDKELSLLGNLLNKMSKKLK